MLRNAWALAIETLSLIESNRMSERLALIKTIKKYEIRDPKAIGLAHRLVFKALRKKNYIDFLLNSVLAPRTLSDLNSPTRAFLRIYVHETKLSNGNLDTATRIARMGRTVLGWWKLNDVEEVLGEILSFRPENSLKCLEEIEKIGFQTFHPAWFVKYCFMLFGRGEALKFLKKSADVSSVYVRLNTLKATQETILENLQDEKIVLEKVPQLKHTYKLIETSKPLTSTQSFNQGLFYIQDKASCLAAEIADPKPEATVLDVCAAPGSKTTYLAQLMENRGLMVSIEYSKRRLRVWQKEIERMGAKNVQPLVADARTSLPLKFSADLVILDPPCTSTGTFGKMPDAKWRLTERSILNMSHIQTEMIEQCTKYVKTGGFFVYSTCSITVEENEMVIEKFLKTHPEFKLAEANPKIGLPGLRGLAKCQRLYPHVHECNGFFVAKLKKETA